MCSQGAVSVYFPSAPLFLITCSMSACSDVSSLILYLARIFMMGLIFSHHCDFGTRCLRQTQNQLSLHLIHSCHSMSLIGGCAAYSKSVSAFRSARGWKVRALFLMPSTQAESGVFAKIRPKQPIKQNCKSAMFFFFCCGCKTGICKHTM